MPPPLPLVLVPHDPRWAAAAAGEGERFRAFAMDVVLVVHHVGSTAIAGLRAKPILDLLPVVRSLEPFDARRGALEAAGYAWWGEYGLPGRRYLTRDEDGTRRAQLHVYAQGSPEIARHLVFRDYVRAHPHAAAAYDAEKVRAAALHADTLGYHHEKAAFVRQLEADALAWAARR